VTEDWTPIFLGIIAFGVILMAAMQVGALVYGARLAARVSQLADLVEREIKPVFANLQTVGAEAARASALATAQVERADRLFAEVSARVEETVGVVQHAIVTPAREGLAVVAGLRAALHTLRDMRDATTRSRAARPEEDDPLFIG
jgi:hypothetical protein